MEIEVLIKEKEELERRLHSAVGEEIRRFKDRTGFSPQAIAIYMRDITGFEDKNPQYMLEEISVSIDAKGVEI